MEARREEIVSRRGVARRAARLDFISSCPFDVRDACCWPASAFLTNSSPRRPLISALCPPFYPPFFPFRALREENSSQSVLQKGREGEERPSYVRKYAQVCACMYVYVRALLVSSEAMWVGV